MKKEELIKKVEKHIPDGGYNELEMARCVYMFQKGYEEAEKDHELSWEDVKEIDKILTDFTVRWSAPIDEDELYREVAKRFSEQKGGEK